MIEDLVAAKRITLSATGNMMPLAAPANINRLTGLPILTKIIVDAMMNRLITIFSFFRMAGCNVFQKETDVNEAPTTEVIAAIQITMPKNL